MINRNYYQNLWSRGEVFLFMFKKSCASEEYAAARTEAHSEEAELMKNGEKVILDFYIIRK